MHQGREGWGEESLKGEGGWRKEWRGVEVGGEGGSGRGLKLGVGGSGGGLKLGGGGVEAGSGGGAEEWRGGVEGG